MSALAGRWPGREHHAGGRALLLQEGWAVAAILLLVHGKTTQTRCCLSHHHNPLHITASLTRPPAVALMGISSAQQKKVQKANSTQPAATAAAVAVAPRPMCQQLPLLQAGPARPLFQNSHHVRHVSAARCCVSAACWLRFHGCCRHPSPPVPTPHSPCTLLPTPCTSLTPPGPLPTHRTSAGGS